MRGRASGREMQRGYRRRGGCVFPATGRESIDRIISLNLRGQVESMHDAGRFDEDFRVAKIAAISLALAAVRAV